jgi:hypothetical protein
MTTYAAVERTLNEISNQMGLAVTPQIDQSTLIQQDCKQAIKENNETVKRLCKEVVQFFVADVTNAVDKRLQTSLQNIRNEADKSVREIQRRNSRSWWEGQAQPMGGSWSSQDFVGRTKKRRMRSPSPYPPRRSASREGHLSSDFMRELEGKIERQARSLFNLAKENEQV